MKKKLLTAMFAIMLSAACGVTYAKTTTNSDLAEAIKMYKAGNYAQCYVQLETAIKSDPSNPLCYYYKAMTAAQIGKKSEAIENYEKTLTLASKRSNLTKYAEKGKRCLETPEQCNEPKYSGADDEFIRGYSKTGLSDDVTEMFERLKIEQMMRDMNRKDDIDPQKFREYRDFSSMNNSPAAMPSNEEIISAVRTLQQAGLMNFGANTYSDLSILTGANNYPVSNIMSSVNMNPQLIQAMFTNNMSLGL